MALDSIGDEDRLFTFAFVKSRLLREKQWSEMREAKQSTGSETSVLIRVLIRHGGTNHVSRFTFQADCFWTNSKSRLQVHKLCL